MEISKLITSCEQGDTEAENQLVGIYFSEVSESARWRIQGNYLRKFDGEDIAISVFGTVINGIRNGRIRVDQEERFRAFLASVTKFKIYQQIEYWSAQERDIRREQEPFQSESESVPSVEVGDAHSKEIAPDDAACLAEMIHRMQEIVDIGTRKCFKGPPSGRELLDARIEGKTYEEICDETHRMYGRTVSTRTISSRMRVIQHLLRDFVIEWKS